MTSNQVGQCGSGERAAKARSARLLLIALALTLATTSRIFADSAATSDSPVLTPETISLDPNPATGENTVINTLIGADRFYDAGYFGEDATIANVEAGYVWNGQESLTNVQNYVSNAPINGTVSDPTPQYDFHATMVGGVLVSLGPPNPDGSYSYLKLGISPLAQLTSVAIATQWDGDGGTFETSSSSFVYGYKTVMQTGVPQQIAPGVFFIHPVDVVNSSFGYADPNTTQQDTLILDALTAVNHQTVCVAAGNNNPGEPTQVTGPASGFNVIAVAALGTDLDVPPYQTQASFSNAGPNDFYNPVTGITLHNVRASVSIAAPGTDLVLPAYTGQTGGNSGGTLFDTSSFTPAELSQLYFLGVDGTSFASPIVAGGADLLVDAGYQNFGGGNSIDGRVIKAVLLNSADKTPGWTNNTQLINGVLTTTQGLDFNVGAGALDLNKAYDQYLSGTTGVSSLTGGTVHPLGWAFGHVTAAARNTYMIDAPLHAGDTFTTTLTWFVNTYFNSNAVADPTTDQFSSSDLTQTYFDQLDLQVWLTSGGSLTTLVADSTSPYNNTDHLYFTIPEDGTYAVTVSYLGTTYDLFNDSPHADDYGLAWSDIATPVPEPASLLILFVGVHALACRRRRRR